MKVYLSFHDSRFFELECLVFSTPEAAIADAKEEMTAYEEAGEEHGFSVKWDMAIRGNKLFCAKADDGTTIWVEEKEVRE